MERRYHMSSIPVVIFPHCSWGQFPYQKLAAVLQTVRPVYYVTGSAPEPVSWPEALQAVTVDDVPAIFNQPALVIVTHPYWVRTVAALRPHRLVVMLPHLTMDEETYLWQKCWAQLSAIADLVCTESETRYLELCLRTSAALLLTGEDPSASATVTIGTEQIPLRDYEVLFLRCIGDLTHEQPGGAAKTAAVQWVLREDYYSLLREQTGPHETVSFLLAVYEYLLGRPSAKPHLIESFRQAAVTEGYGSSLTTHYRFLSAVHAQNDELEEAIHVYGITAVSEEERQSYEQLCRWMEQNRAGLAKAEVFRLNDDYQSALAALSGVFGTEARRLRMRICLDAGWMEAALECLTPEERLGPSDVKAHKLLTGTVMSMRGRWHEAIRLFLEVALNEEEALAHIVEIDALEEGLERLRDRISDSGNGGVANER